MYYVMRGGVTCRVVEALKPADGVRLTPEPPDPSHELTRGFD